ncbi:ribosomal large subunit pseudouridine synthase D [Sphingobium quisquiliarum P25]|uniref:Pseudouridine synthase n=1 Tax=Sphingobium quisquiliarum P25 TaxID=1329909 RepID=T0GFZ9_9SPHN|nr:RluA family pseudouridine synthase [Sphingobium quisquiliarum]EQB02661.1 ribosomal large subunit pseudouridine synthase D [Sphingobium quisquiliarum P25]
MGSGVSIIEAVIGEAQQGLRLDKALADLLPGLSRERLKALIVEGQVTAGGRSLNPSLKVAAGQTFAIALPAPVEAEAVAQDIPLSIVHEDADLIVIDKPAGLVVHPAAGNLDGTLVNALLHHCRGQLSGIGGVARPGIVHRIDKDTSGLLVVAKSDKAHEGLAQQFKDHSIDRLYAAIVYGIPQTAAGTVDTWIGRSDSDRKKMAVHREGRGKHAVTHYRVVERLRGAALVECRLETGRTHQVRVHMAHLGHPLIGDPVYGRDRKGFKSILETLGFKRQALHAKRLGFIHPVTGEKLSFDSALPTDMQELLRQIHV